MIATTLIARITVVVLMQVSGAAPAVPQWIDAVRKCMLRKDLACAKGAVAQELTAHPSNLEALNWRARLLGWSGNLDGAERGYHAVLASDPNNADALLGLADVQYWKGDYAAALATLKQAERAHAVATEVLPRRARALARLGRKTEAIQAYEQLLRIDPSENAVRKELQALRADHIRRHELRIGSDTDTFNYTGVANSEVLSLNSRWNERWSTRFAGTFYQRFGQSAEKLNVAATFRFSTRDWATVDVGISNRQDVAPQEEANFEYGHGFRLRKGPIRGIESYIQQRNFWYSTSRVTTIGTTQVLYLPRDWTWTIGVTGVRTTFASARSEWIPAGFTRLSAPVSSRVIANGLFAVGAENFAKIDQVGRFSAHTFGGGVRVQITASQDISGYVAFQNRTQGRTQTSVGVSYGRRF